MSLWFKALFSRLICINLWLLTGISLLLAACAGGGGDFAPTETAIAARVMTQIAQTPCACSPDGATLAAPGATRTGPLTIDTRVLKNLNPSQESCLRQSINEAALRDLVNLIRPPDEKEAEAILKCIGQAALQATPVAGGLPPLPALPPGMSNTPVPGASPTRSATLPALPPGVTLGAPTAPGAPTPTRTTAPGGPSVLTPPASQPTLPSQPSQATPSPTPVGQGPYNHQVLLARSSDGLSWQPEGIPVRLRASSPAIVSLRNGTLFLYVHDGLSDDIAAVRRQPNATTWEEVRISIRGRSVRRSYEPEVILLPDGRLRLFYYGPAEPYNPALPSVIYSAVSSDGITFDQEAGERIALFGVGEPSVVILPNNTWLMALTRGTETILASSLDGKAFTATGVTLSQGTSPKLALRPEGGLRLYLVDGNAIISLLSQDDGRTWQPESGVRLQIVGNIAADPSVVRLDDGTWLMAWRRYDPQSIRTP